MPQDIVDAVLDSPPKQPDIIDTVLDSASDKTPGSPTPEIDKAVATTAGALDPNTYGLDISGQVNQFLHTPAGRASEKIASATVEKLGGLIPHSASDVAGMLTPVVPAMQSLITEAHVFKPHFENAKAQLYGEPIPHLEIAAKTFDQFNQDDWIRFGVSNAVDLANAALLRKGMIRGGEISAEKVGTEIKTPGGQAQGLEQEAPGSVRLRDATQDRVDTQHPEILTTKGGVDETEVQKGGMETQGTGQEKALETPLASTAEPAAVSGPASPAAAEPPSGISNERLQQIYGEDAITAGKGLGAQEWQRIGQADTRDPYAAMSAAQARGIASPKDVALFRAEHQRLLNTARNAYGTPQYGELAQNSADMANAIKRVAHGPASDVFRALQDVDVPRYDSPADFDSIVRERMNRESTPDEHATFQKISGELRNGDQEVIRAASEAQNNLRRYRPNEVMSFDDAVNHIKDQIKSITTDCNL